MMINLKLIDGIHFVTAEFINEGILGTDFLMSSKAVIDMDKLMISFKDEVSEDVK